jgi:hypothetical protein
MARSGAGVRQMAAVCHRALARDGNALHGGFVVMPFRRASGLTVSDLQTLVLAWEGVGEGRFAHGGRG